MCLTFREDFTSINRNWNLNSRTKLLSQLICMKLIGQLKQQLLTYMSVAEIWNRWTLNNFIFLLKITGKFHYMSEEKVANYFTSNSCGYIPPFSRLRKSRLASTSLFCISFLLLSAHPPPFSLRYVLVRWFYIWLLYITEDLKLQIKTFSSGRNHTLRLQVSNPVCLFS